MKMKLTEKRIIYTLTILFCGLFMACQTVPKIISQDLDATQLIQRGQDAYANGNYKAAEVYYNTVIDRFGADLKRYVEAKYEIGHLYMKLKKYDKAEATFNEITGLFESTSPGSLPGAYKKLCALEMEKIKVANEKKAGSLAKKPKKTK